MQWGAELGDTKISFPPRVSRNWQISDMEIQCGCISVTSLVPVGYQQPWGSVPPSVLLMKGLSIP